MSYNKVFPAAKNTSRRRIPKTLIIFCLYCEHKTFEKYCETERMRSVK